MNFLRNSKKPGFTLMEIAIAVMIVGLLIALCLPVVNDQLTKSKSYSYYLAYKTVEKLGGQIVALGDPALALEDNDVKIADNSNHFKFIDTKILSQKLTYNLILLKNKLVYSEQYFFKKLFPKSVAIEPSVTEVYRWDSEQFKEVNLAYRICEGERIVKTEAYTDESGVEHPAEYYTRADIGGCTGYTEAADGVPKNSQMYTFFNTDVCQLSTAEDQAQRQAEITAYLQTAANFVKQPGNENEAKTFCQSWSYVTGKCQRTDLVNTNISYSVSYTEDRIPGYVDDENHEWPEEVIGTCTIIKTEVIPDTGDEKEDQWVRPEVDGNVCSESSGYYNMVNAGAPYGVNCQCKTDYPVFSSNNSKVCCKACEDSSATPYATLKNECICCTGDYNPLFSSGGVLGKCCPAHSLFNGSKCECVDGYVMEREGTADEECVIGKCAPGFRLDPVNRVCITNPPILSGQRLCELIKSNWNVNSASCGSWQSSNNVKYNKSVYDAATGTNGRFISIASKDGAFANIKPNIEFANGLTMWILSDKSASLPGLSYDPTNVSPSQNVCINLNKSTKADCRDASGGKGYFCQSENNCYTMDASSLAALGDARNCCAATDLGNLASKDPDNYEKDNRAFAINGFTVFVDIDGSNKGPGTLWDDVFPFFVSANGRVYPAYPLDGLKAANATDSSVYSGGNSSANLPTDVYYFESDTSGKKRVKINAYSAVSYARAACLSGIVNSHTPYCMNLGEKFKDRYAGSTNPCSTHKCFMSLRPKLRFF